jgi:hypothetical protein
MKISGKEMRQFKGPARVFDGIHFLFLPSFSLSLFNELTKYQGEEAALDAILNGTN